MLSIINSIFNMQGGQVNENPFKNIIINTIKNNKLLYTEVSSGINININDQYTIVIPYNFNTEYYIQIKKELKDSDGNCIGCIYLYKFINNSLKFVNRIKILDLSSIKCDEDSSRIDLKLVTLVEKLLNEIIGHYNKKLVGGGNNYDDSITNTDINDYNYLKETSKYKSMKKILHTTLTESATSDLSESSYESRTD
jgi:hypothetical protein